MSERLFILGVVVLAVLAGGMLTRAWAKRRRDHLMESVPSEPSTVGAARILSFYGPSCDACERQKAILAELVSERPDEVTVELRDASASYETARKYGLVIVPTTVVFRADGAIAAINSGFTPRPVIEAQLAA